MKRQCEPPRDEIQRIVTEVFVDSDSTKYCPVCAQPNVTEENLRDSYYKKNYKKKIKNIKTHTNN